MSKSTKSRVVRAVSHAALRLTSAEYVNLILAPRLHLELILSSERVESYYLISVVGVFNVATALAYMHKDKRAIALYDSVQNTVLQMAQEGADGMEERDHLRRVFNIADDYIGRHGRADILRAIRVVEYQIKHGEGTSLLRVDLPESTEEACTDMGV